MNPRGVPPNTTRVPTAKALTPTGSSKSNMRALIVGGGGMRGAYCSGVTHALQDMGLHFDAVYGTSAGGAMAAWFSAGQADDGRRTWPYANDRRVLSYRRYLTQRGPLIDLDMLFDHVYPNEVGLDIARFPRLNHPVYVTATDVDSGLCAYLDLRQVPVLDALKATSALPFVTSGPVAVNGNRYLDGGLADPAPLRRAIEDGADDIIVIFNRPRRERQPEPRLATWAFERSYPQLGHVARRHDEICNEISRLAHEPPEHLRIRVLRPEHDLGVSRLTRDPERLERALAYGYDHAHEVLA